MRRTTKSSTTPSTCPCSRSSNATRAPPARTRSAGGRPPALRLRADGERVAFEDRLLGRVEAAVDDVVVRRNDGAPAYNLAVIVDDVWQRIGEVVRGDDLLDSTPGQLFLAEALGLEPPAYAHVPLVLAPDGARLAKRHGAVTLGELEPRAVLRWMAATLGMPGAATAADIRERFDPVALPREPIRWAGLPRG